MRYLHGIIFLLLGMNLQAQTGNPEQELQRFVQNINVFSYLYPQEKVYLHFDNTGYFLGENIWFKSYVVTAENNQFSQLSKVLYVELLTPEGKVMQTKKLKLEEGQAHGDFYLKDSLYAGFYEIRAYTKCMLNFGEDVVFSRVFPVFDKPKQEGAYTEKKMTVRDSKKRVANYRKKIPKTDDIDIAFFPEGGNLLTGLSNKIAFKATDKQGRSIDVIGKVYNSGREEVASFSTVHQGMGSFLIYPDGNKYTVEVEYDGKKRKMDLPQSLSQGYTLMVDNLHPKNMLVQINKTVDTLVETIGVSFSCRGKVYAFEIFDVEERQPKLFSLPKEMFPSGIVQITLFTSNGEILAERLAFVRHNESQGRITTVSVKTDYSPLSPIAIDFEVKDLQSDPLETSFSLSVRDSSADIRTNYTGNIMTNLLLASEIKGYIEDPDYYFEKDDIRRRMALDLLLMTQGWRRYSWKQMACVELFDVKYGIEDVLMMEGKILSDAKKKEKKNVDVNFKLYSADGKKQEGHCVTDSVGYFNFALSDFYGTADLQIETREKGKLKSNRIQLDRLFSPTPKYFQYGELNPFMSIRNQNAAEEDALSNTAFTDIVYVNDSVDTTIKAHALSEITITEKKKYNKEQDGLKNASVVYNVEEEVDRIRDLGENEVSGVLDLIEQLNESFVYNYEIFTDNSTGLPVYDVIAKYKTRDVVFVVDNTLARVAPTGDLTRETFNNYNEDHTINIRVTTSLLDMEIDLIESIMIAEDGNAALLYSPECGRTKVNPSTGRLGEDKYAAPKECYVIYIYTNKGGYSSKQRKGIRETKFAGFANVREFHNPDYNYVVMPDQKDFRRTLYWNPDVKTDKEGKVIIGFFNNSTAKKFTISAEGISNGIFLSE